MSMQAVYSRGKNHRLTYTETLYCEATSNTLVVLFMWSAGGWRWVGGWIKGSRVLLSTKFHYPIDTDLPPSQHFLVLCVSTFLSCWNLFFSFTHGSCRDQLRVRQRGLSCYCRWGGGSDIDIPVWEWGGGVSRFLSSTAIEIWTQRHGKFACQKTAWKLIRFPLNQGK